MVTSRLVKTISTDFEARVLKMHVASGQVVKAGELVAELDTTELRSKLAEAEAKRMEAAGQAGAAYARAQNAQRAMKMEARLARSGASSPEAGRTKAAEYATAAAEGGAAGAQVKAAQTVIDETNRLLNLAKVTSPIDGTVSVLARSHDGEVAHKGQPILRVFDPNDLEVKFAVPHIEKDSVKVGQQLELELEKGTRVRVTVKTLSDDHDPNIDFNIAEADFDASVARTDEIHVGAGGHVRIADKGATR